MSSYNSSRSIARILVITALILCSLILGSAGSAWSESSNLPEYKPSKLKLSRLTSVGSETIGGLVEQWVAAYREFQPEVTIDVVSRGSATAAPALIEGTANLGHMVRPMKESELQDFKIKFGFEPTQIRVALAGIAVYVNKQNPIDKISFDQLESLYSATPVRSQAGKLAKWKDLGVRGAFAEKPPVLIGALADSYPQTFFKQQVLLQSQFVDGLMTTSTPAALFESIRLNPEAIGYGEIRIAPEDVKALAISRPNDQGDEQGDTEAYEPSENNVVTGKYPLSRYLNLYFVRSPDKPLEPTTVDFLHFVLSKQGQEIAVKEGFIPLPSSVVREELDSL